jgi:chemotaxis family two-component system sensor kinase Cph1
MWAVGVVLMGVLVFDIYQDWIQQGEPLISTLLENSPPLALSGTLLYGTYWLYRRRSRRYLATVARWTLVGLIGIMFVLGWVIGNQALQSQFKPFVIVAHTAIGGALAGAGVGYATAGIEQSRATVETERDRWQSLFENDHGGIAELRFESGTPVVETCNEAFRELFELGERAVEGKRLTDLVEHEQTDVGDDIAAAIKREETFSTEVTTTTGEATYFKLRVVPYGIGKGEKRAFAIYTDVTELHETQEELQARMDDLEASNERLQQFAYIASHDLQEPLRMVSSYMGLLEEEYRDELDAEAREYIDFAADGADRMQDMIDGLLAYSRVQTEGEEFAAIDATEALEEALQALELRIEEADATVRYDDLPTVEADRSQLSQLFQNLVENAIDHGGEDVTVDIDGQRRDSEVVFSVEDDGPGIPESQQERVFELFARGDRDDDSTGMGLAICERIVSRHGGDIRVESTEGEGTTFYVSLPAAE